MVVPSLDCGRVYAFITDPSTVVAGGSRDKKR